MEKSGFFSSQYKFKGMVLVDGITMAGPCAAEREITQRDWE